MLHCLFYLSNRKKDVTIIIIHLFFCKTDNSRRSESCVIICHPNRGFISFLSLKWPSVAVNRTFSWYRYCRFFVILQIILLKGSRNFDTRKIFTPVNLPLTQASVQRNIPIYKAAVKNNLEVRIDQDNFIPADV